MKANCPAARLALLIQFRGRSSCPPCSRIGLSPLEHATSRHRPVLGIGALILLALLLCLVTSRGQSLNQATAFEGVLNLEGAAANGTFDIAYRVVASADLSGVSDDGGPLSTNLAVAVRQGVFTTGISIPAEAADWPRSFLELHIRPSGDGTFQPLAPRLPLVPVPASLVADTARAVSAGAVTAAALGANAVTTAGLADGAITSAKVLGGQLLKSLNGLTDDVTLEAGEGLVLSTAGKKITLAMPGFCLPWCLLGNLGTTPAPPLTVVSSGAELRWHTGQ